MAAEAAVGAMVMARAPIPAAEASRAADLRMRAAITGMWEFDLNRVGASPRRSQAQEYLAAGV
ncbi:hypothetical protein GCM10010442_53440 [Kitasatospora kifunensis]